MYVYIWVHPESSSLHPGQGPPCACRYSFPIYITICRSLYFDVCIFIYVNVYFQIALYIVMLRK